MSDLGMLTAELMQDPLFREEYERLQTERELQDSVIAAREKAGLTQKELARKSGVCLSAVKGLEESGRLPGLAKLRRIADALNLNFRITLQERAA